MLSVEALIDPGDRVVCVTPLWPNLTEIPKILGAEVVRVALSFGAGGWTLDVSPAARRADAGHARGADQFAEQSDRLDDRSRAGRQRSSSIAASTASGSSPTTSTSACITTRRPRGLRPSFLDSRSPGDRVVSTNSFSKAWLMTGWRLGWIVAPPHAAARPGQADRIQHLVLADVRAARGRRRDQRRRSDDRAYARARYRAARDFLVARAERDSGISRRGANRGDVRLLPRRRRHRQPRVLQAAACARSRLGLAPGSAFGPEGEGFVRWCFRGGHRPAPPTASQRCAAHSAESDAQMSTLRYA